MISNSITTLSNSVMGNLFIILALIFALVCCFNGYKLFKVLIKFYGFLIFFALGLVVGSILGLSGQMLTIIGFCSGLLGIFLAYKFYKGMVVFTIAYQTYIVLMMIIPSTFIVVIISIVIGFLATNFIKPVVSVTTAISSALFISSILITLIPFVAPFEIFITIGFAIAGSVKQLFK